MRNKTAKGQRKVTLLTETEVKEIRAFIRKPPREGLRECPECKAMAVVPLPPVLVRCQPDDTRLVCHPTLGGCNQGFTLEGLN